MSANQYPAYTLEIKFDLTNWTTVASPRQAHIRRGRQDELGTVQAGEMVVVADNAAGNLSPDNASGAYYPNVLPLRPVRLSATYNSVTYRLFTGYIESYQPGDNGPVDADMILTCRDWTLFANLAKLTTTFAAQDEGARIAAVIAAVGARGSATSIATGPETLLAATLTDASALSHIADVIAAERGIFYVAADGTLTYQDRHWRFANARGNTSQATFGQPGGGGSYAVGTLGFKDIEYTLEDRDIYNDVRIRASGTAEAQQTSTDATSQTAYGVRTYQLDSPVMATGQASELAKWLLASYKDPVPRVRSLTVDGDGGATHWPHVLGREISDRITVVKANPGALGINRQMWIEGVEHDIRPDQGGHVVKWQLSDTGSAGPTPWTLDVSALDVNTVLRY